ncbi:MAG TPA: DUF427 domain-containing protein [Acetobacteraceae bacterium]|nr:DUF427 domain-containing protein [Acetobacteraceae bacterium]
MAVQMKEPGPAHAISVHPEGSRVRVSFNGRVIAETTRAKRLQEGSLPPVLYIPRDDADMTALRRTAHHTHCPFKGDASYYSIEADGERAENAVWTYEDPYPPAVPVTNFLAFYPDKVRIVTEPA